MIQNTSFQGTHFADAHVLNNKISLYKLTSKDLPFTTKLSSSLDLPELYPNLKGQEYIIWEEMIRHGLTDIMSPKDSVILAACGKTPCGVINYTLNQPRSVCNFVGTWPVEKGKKVPLAGMSLFSEMFSNFLSGKSQFLELYAMKYSPFSPVAKYLSLGFKPRGGDNFQEVMRITRENAAKTIEKFKECISIKPLKTPKDVDLFSILKISGSK